MDLIFQLLCQSLRQLPKVPRVAMSTEEGARMPKGIEKSINQVNLLGRVGVDPQLRGTDAHPVVAFSLATNIRYKPGGPDSGNDYITKTEWHNVAVFKTSLRESALQTVTKGMRVLVQGRIMYGSIEDKQGNIRHTTTIVAEDVIKFGG